MSRKTISKWSQYEETTRSAINCDRQAKSSVAPKVIGFGAAAVGGLMTCGDLEADIIYSGPLNTVINTNSTMAFDFNVDALNDLRLTVISSSFNADGLNGGDIFANPGSSTYAQKFNFGDLIPDTAGSVGLGFMGWYFGGIASDPWGALQAGVNASGPVTGFMGFTFGGFNGWMELSLLADSIGIPVSMTVKGWAYDNTGAPIAAGNFNAVPEPGTAGVAAMVMLAAGAVGLRRRRVSE